MFGPEALVGMAEGPHASTKPFQGIVNTRSSRSRMSRHAKGIAAGNARILSLRRIAARLPPRQILKETVAASKQKPSDAVAMISVAYEE